MVAIARKHWRRALRQSWRTAGWGQLRRALSQPFETWVAHRHRPQRLPIQLNRRCVYILPTGYGYAFAAILAVMLLWAINYNNSMGFALTFLLGAVALNGMWRTNNNLLDLRVHPAGVEPQFVGQLVRFSYRIENPTPFGRYGIALQGRDCALGFADIPACGATDLVLSIPATRRGLLRPGRLCISTRFPLGLFRAWSWVEFDQCCLVYPKPAGGRKLSSVAVTNHAGGLHDQAAGSEDYAGLRNYIAGDSPRHVAWKAMPREDALLVKCFVGQTQSECWLEWNSLAPEPVEVRLSQLCLWVLQAEATGRRYGLRLPGVELHPDRGEKQRHGCLQALALFGSGESDGRSGD